MTSKPQIGIVGFTGCAGCQLSILDLENELLDLLGLVDIIDFRMAMSGNKKGPYDILFVEGSIVNKHQEEELIELREKAKVLVAIGSCASFGGLQAIRYHLLLMIISAFLGHQTLEKFVQTILNVKVSVLMIKFQQIMKLLAIALNGLKTL